MRTLVRNDGRDSAAVGHGDVATLSSFLFCDSVVLYRILVFDLLSVAQLSVRSKP